MKTPEQKAKELVEKFEDDLMECDTYFLEAAKKRCALIAVDEIIDLNLGLSNCDENNWAIEKFYLEVQQEIQKL
jgi:hypothetical protein